MNPKHTGNSKLFYSETWTTILYSVKTSNSISRLWVYLRGRASKRHRAATPAASGTTNTQE